MDRADVTRCLLDHQYLPLTDWEDVLNTHAIAEPTLPTTSATVCATDTVWNHVYDTVPDVLPRSSTTRTHGASGPVTDRNVPPSWALSTSYTRTSPSNTSLQDVPLTSTRFQDDVVRSANTLRVPTGKFELPVTDGDVSLVKCQSSPYGQRVVCSSRRGGHVGCGMTTRKPTTATARHGTAPAEGEADLRKQRRREQNRRAAQRCRARRKMREVTITQELQKEMMTMNFLESQLHLLTSEKHDLEMTLAQHGVCRVSTDWQQSLQTDLESSSPLVLEVTAL